MSIGGGAIRRQHWLMPADVSKSGSVQRLLVNPDIEKVVLDVQRAVVQVERPGNRRPFAERTDNRGFESIFSVGRRRPKIACRIAVHCYEPSARPETTRNPAAHRIQLRGIARIV